MTNITFAVGGIIFVMLVMPVIQSVSDFVSTLFQWFISIVNIKITQNNVKVQKYQELLAPENSNVIGFQMSDEYAYDEDFDDDGEDCETDKKMNKIGF